MLVIRVEIWKHGDRKQREVITEMKIVNTGDHYVRPLYGNYKVEVEGENTKVFDHDRRDNVWHLVKKAVDAILKTKKF